MREQSVAVTSRKARWHQSTLSTLLDGCSWQYFLTYIAELEQSLNGNAIVGIAYHGAVEKAQKARFKNKETTLEKPIVTGKDRKSTRLNSSHLKLSRMPSSA